MIVEKIKINEQLVFDIWHLFDFNDNKYFYYVIESGNGGNAYARQFGKKFNNLDSAIDHCLRLKRK